MVKRAGLHSAVVTTGRITDQNLVMVLVGLRRLFRMLLFSSIRNRIKGTIHSSNGHLDASIRTIHLLLAIFAD
jgi:hypothetical protein